ncbi:HlyU family transcriptional regulator [Aquibaculum arenosum]|uniref:HlyU family transcriptional regulator n=1 Tax=Aquibaculum arenosum TaxID=3032591 RepID=A0ABT5YPQ8_9PROT|nr:HlyU family transcriptional regulator [Fodinicurvata sp. CAU 1616]MDF2096964.1 HlyU family transcriptional regulator [Fodinicurvata sp. CAU 1616]
MTGFLSRLFGGGPAREPAAAASEEAEPLDYKGLTIEPAPVQQDGQWRVAGTIRKDAGTDREMERVFQRADCFASREDAVSFTVIKGKQIIDQRTDLFADGEPTGRA